MRNYSASEREQLTDAWCQQTLPGSVATTENLIDTSNHTEYQRLSGATHNSQFSPAAK
jgi:hypothetical protein